MDVFPKARTGKVTYMNDRGRMIASLVGGITCSAMEGGEPSHDEDSLRRRREGRPEATHQTSGGGLAIHRLLRTDPAVLAPLLESRLNRLMEVPVVIYDLKLL